MKKRTLLVSTAILLVAVMALATASYAWFTAGANAKAVGLNISASAGSSLLIRGNDDPADVFGKVGTDATTVTNMVPATSSDGAAFYQIDTTKAEVLSAGNFAATKIGGGTIAASDLKIADETTYFAEAIYQIKNVGSESKDVVASLDIKIGGTAVSADIWKAVRVAVFVKDTSASTYTLGGIYAISGANASAVGGSLAAPSLATANSTVIIDDLPGNTIKDVKLVAWFEGQDENCKTNNVVVGGADIVVTFNTAA